MRTDNFPHQARRNDQMKFFTVAEVAEHLEVATRTVRRGSGPLVWWHIGLGVVRIGKDEQK